MEKKSLSKPQYALLFAADLRRTYVFLKEFRVKQALARRLASSVAQEICQAQQQ